jgi:hypothetical protein
LHATDEEAEGLSQLHAQQAPRHIIIRMPEYTERGGLATDIDKLEVDQMIEREKLKRPAALVRAWPDLPLLLGSDSLYFVGHGDYSSIGNVGGVALADAILNKLSSGRLKKVKLITCHGAEEDETIQDPSISAGCSRAGSRITSARTSSLTPATFCPSPAPRPPTRRSPRGPP